MTEVQSGHTMILSYVYMHLSSAPRIVIPTIANVAGQDVSLLVEEIAPHGYTSGCEVVNGR